MTSLNGDNSWLLSFPRPEKELKFSSKLYYHIVFEPWLVGPVSIVSSWLIHITPSQTAAVQTVEAIDKLIGEVEALGMRESGLDVCRLFDGNDTRPKVDAVSFKCLKLYREGHHIAKVVTHPDLPRLPLHRPSPRTNPPPLRPQHTRCSNSRSNRYSETMELLHLHPQHQRLPYHSHIMAGPNVASRRPVSGMAYTTPSARPPRTQLHHRANLVTSIALKSRRNRSRNPAPITSRHFVSKCAA